MAVDANSGLATYLEQVAAGTPTPGGGSVAAVVGALAAALGEMVANLTLGRPKYARVPVPDVMFCSRMRVTWYATPSGITRFGLGLPHPADVSRSPFGNSTRRIAIGSW